jgi:hypothetical protein
MLVTTVVTVTCYNTSDSGLTVIDGVLESAGTKA